MTKGVAIKLTYEGKTLTLREWSVLKQIPLSTIRRRHSRRLPVADILSRTALERAPYIMERSRFDRRAEWKLNAERPSHGHRTFFTFNGERRSLAEWSVIAGVCVQTLQSRIRAGKSADEVMKPVEPLKTSSPKFEKKRPATLLSPITFMGETMTVEQWADDLSLPVCLVLERLNNGATAEEAFAKPPTFRKPKGWKGQPSAVMRLPSPQEMLALTA